MNLGKSIYLNKYIPYYNSIINIMISNIDHDKCMARKDNTYQLFEQCDNIKFIDDYCIDHSISTHVLRIDEEIPEKYVNVMLNIFTQVIKRKDPDIFNIHDISNDNETIFNIKQKSSFTPFSTKLEKKVIDLPPALLNFQKKIRDKTFQKISGPAYNNTCLSHDDVDPISQEILWEIKDGIKLSVNEIPKHLLFSYTDSKGFVRCFNISSLYELFNQNIYKHPITNEDIPELALQNAKKKIKILEHSGVLQKEIDNGIITPDKIKNITFNTFAKLHKYNIYIKDKWFLDLNITELGKMYYETKDFFEKNIQTEEQRKLLIPPHGIAFEKSSDIIKSCKNKLFVQYYLLTNIDKIISNCKTESMQTMGTYIVLGGLCTVSKETRECYPDFSFSFM